MNLTTVTKKLRKNWLLCWNRCNDYEADVVKTLSKPRQNVVLTSNDTQKVMDLLIVW